MSFGRLSTQEASDVLGLSVRTLRNYVKEGKLHPKKLGRTYYFEEEELKALFQDCRPRVAQ